MLQSNVQAYYLLAGPDYSGGNCPGPSAPRGPPWWHLFVSNKIFVWNIVV